MYTQEEISKAIKTYKQLGLITATMIQLGYPSKQTLYNWLKNDELKSRLSHQEDTFIKSRKTRENYTPEFKLSAIKRCFENKEEIRKVSIELGISRPCLYNWRKKYLKGGVFGLMKKHEIERGPLNKSSTKIANLSNKEVQALQEHIQDLQMEVDILKEVIGVLKKDPGIDRSALKNREKGVIIDALKEKYPLLRLLWAMDLARSSYYYHMSKPPSTNKLDTLCEQIKLAFNDSFESYGYRRIQIVLHKSDIRRSDKVIRRLMKQMSLFPKKKKTRTYSSYQGEISPAPVNLVNRRFTAEVKNELWLTDITEFSIPAGKLYCSPIIDCFDGLLVSWSLSESPNALLVNKCLNQACETLSLNEKPVIHSDRGGHYRWFEWIEITERYGLTRSMSKKGCTADNSACEGFFGRMKNECFYDRDFSTFTMELFKNYINQYLNWYNYERITLKLKCSPMQSRLQLRIA